MAEPMNSVGARTQVFKSLEKKESNWNDMKIIWNSTRSPDSYRVVNFAKNVATYALIFFANIPALKRITQYPASWIAQVINKISPPTERKEAVTGGPSSSSADGEEHQAAVSTAVEDAVEVAVEVAVEDADTDGAVAAVTGGSSSRAPSPSLSLVLPSSNVVDDGNESDGDSCAKFVGVGVALAAALAAVKFFVK